MSEFKTRTNSNGITYRRIAEMLDGEELSRPDVSLSDYLRVIWTRLNEHEKRISALVSEARMPNDSTI